MSWTLRVSLISSTDSSRVGKGDGGPGGGEERGDGEAKRAGGGGKKKAEGGAGGIRGGHVKDRGDGRIWRKKERSQESAEKLRQIEQWMMEVEDEMKERSRRRGRS